MALNPDKLYLMGFFRLQKPFPQIRILHWLFLTVVPVFLEHVPVKAVFPMHCWDHYEICQKVQDEPSMQGLLEHFHPIEYKGQEWTLC